MNIRTQLLSTPLICLSLLLATSTFANAETLEQRIKKLERLVLELKQQIEADNKPNKAPSSKKTTSKAQSSYKFGGFIKATASLSTYSDGDLAAGSAGRDFFIPGTIPVGGTDESTDFDFSAKETRINFKSKHSLNNGKTLSTHLEMDFLLPTGGNERVSNSYNPRLRHAYFTYDNWLFGQTWSTFQDLGALPEAVDFLAASDGIIFERQPMIRYTRGSWAFALENPETTITPFGGGGRIVADDNATPDFVAKYTHKGNWGHFAIAGLYRTLSYENGAIDDSSSAFGVSLTGKIKLGERDDIRFNFATGEGMGRYVGLNTANGAVIDGLGNLVAVESSLGAIAFRHFWTPKFRSNLIYSTMQIDNDTNLTGLGVTESVETVQINFLYSPAPKYSVGIGYLFSTRELENGDEGDLDRLIFSARYGF